MKCCNTNNQQPKTNNQQPTTNQRIILEIERANLEVQSERKYINRDVFLFCFDSASFSTVLGFFCFNISAVIDETLPTYRAYCTYCTYQVVAEIYFQDFSRFKSMEQPFLPPAFETFTSLAQKLKIRSESPGFDSLLNLKNVLLAGVFLAAASYAPFFKHRGAVSNISLCSRCAVFKQTQTALS